MRVQDEDTHSKTTENALLLIESVRSALRNGVKHFSKAGTPLVTVLEVIEALTRDGEVTLHDAGQ